MIISLFILKKIPWELAEPGSWGNTVMFLLAFSYLEMMIDRLAWGSIVGKWSMIDR